MQKGFAPILIILGIVLLLGLAGGAYYFGKSQTPKPQNPVVASQTPKPIITPSPTPDTSPAPTGAGETATWKTYTNTKYRYSFKYPSNWVEIASYQQPDILKLEIGLKDVNYYFIVGAGGRGGPPADEIKGDNPKYSNISFSRRAWIKDGTPFFIVALPDKPYSVGGNIEILFPSTEADYYTKTFDQILSTFKFTQ